MTSSKYAFAVEIDTNLFEIFEIVYVEKDSDKDKRYKIATASLAIGIKAKSHKNIKVGSTYNNGFFESEDKDGFFEFDENQSVYVVLSNNKVFSITAILNDHPSFQKWEAAFDSNVIMIDVSSETNIGLGDLWDGQKITHML